MFNNISSSRFLSPLYTAAFPWIRFHFDVELWIATLYFIVVGLCTFDKCYWILLTYLLPQLPCQSLPVPFRRFFVCLLATLHKNGFAWNFQGRWVWEPPKFQIWKSSFSARKVRGSTWHTDQRKFGIAQNFHSCLPLALIGEGVLLNFKIWHT